MKNREKTFYPGKKKRFLEGKFMCAPNFLCALVLRLVCAHTCTQSCTDRQAFSRSFSKFSQIFAA